MAHATAEPERDPRFTELADVGPGGVRAFLAELVGDPSLELVFWVLSCRRGSTGTAWWRRCRPVANAP